MKGNSQTADFRILQQIFADIANEIRSDPIEHLLVITYEFDEQQLINLLSGKRLADNDELQRNQIKFIADMHPVVIYDARKTREFNQLPHFLDLLPIHSGAYRCHHSKAYLFVTRDTVKLLLGSFNLTHTGLFKNREVFAEFLWSDKNLNDLSVLRDFNKLLREGYERWDHPNKTDARHIIADTIDKRLARWQPKKAINKHALLYSGYPLIDSPQGLSHLANLWKSISDTAPKKMFVVSPFFDRDKNCLANSIVKKIGIPNELHIVTDDATIVKLRQHHYGPKKIKQIRKLNIIPSSIGTNERKRIARANDNANLDDLEIVRTLHAKIIVLSSKNNHLVYIGSANFTLKAWNGDNKEIGVVSIKNGNGNKLISEIITAVGASNSNVYERLDDSPIDSEQPDDEGYDEQPGYPDFVKGILLEEDNNGKGLIFRFNITDAMLLANYDIYWGRTRLTIQDICSQAISREQAYMPLQGGRNLRFVLHNKPEIYYFLPFTHDSELTRQQDILIFPSIDDWMNYYIHINYNMNNYESEYIPGQNDKFTDNNNYSLNRDSNIIISMQHYLNLFSKIEATFHQRADKIVSTNFPDNESKKMELKKTISDPLSVLIQILNNERRKKNDTVLDQKYLFQLGELILLCIALTKKIPEFKYFTQKIAAKLNIEKQNSTMSTYIKFIKERISHV